MKLEFLIILIIRIIFGSFIFITGFLLGITLGKDRCQKKISKILDDALGDISKIKGDK